VPLFIIQVLPREIQTALETVLLLCSIVVTLMLQLGIISSSPIV
jgi:hypothetical protein